MRPAPRRWAFILVVAFSSLLAAAVVSESSFNRLEEGKNRVIEGTTGGLLQEVVWNDPVFRDNLRSFLENIMKSVSAGESAEATLKRFGATAVLHIADDGSIISTAGEYSVGPRLPHHFQCYEVINGRKSHHFFGVEREVHCEPNVFGVSFRTAPGRSVRVMFDVHGLEKFLNRERITTLLRDISEYQSIPRLELLGSDGSVIASFQRPGSTPDGLARKSYQIKLKGLALLTLAAYSGAGPEDDLRRQNRWTLALCFAAFLAIWAVYEKYHSLRDYAAGLATDILRLEEFSRAALSAFPGPALMVTSEGKCFSLNGSGAEFIGGASMDGAPFEKVAVFAANPGLAALVASAGEGARPDIVFGTGEYSFKLYRVEFVRVGDRALLLFVDASGERVQALETGRGFEQSVTTLISAKIAHELRNPLNTIGMSLQMIASADVCGSREGRASYEEHVRFALEETERLNRILKGYLNRGTAGIPMREVDLVSLSAYTVSVVKRYVRSRPGLAVPEIRMGGFPEKATIKGNYDLIVQTLYNLLLNAVQAIDASSGTGAKPGGTRIVPGAGTISAPSKNASEEFPASLDPVVSAAPSVDGATAGAASPGRISVSFARDENGYIITVEDDGGGIPPANLAKIFDAGFTTKPDGSGLGLPIAAEAMKQHGGSLDVSSREGRTVARLRFPF